MPKLKIFLIFLILVVFGLGLVGLVEAAPSTELPFFIESGGQLNIQTGTSGGEIGDIAPPELNDYGDSTQKCDQWKCTAWGYGFGVSYKDAYCSGYWDCQAWNGSVCDQWKCTVWAAGTTAEKITYCSGYWDCTTWNGSVCDQWKCTAWSQPSSVQRDEYCSGYWDCQAWNGSVCDQWKCTVWTMGSYNSYKYYCSGYWNCQAWNGSVCDQWKCSSWSSYSSYGLYCSGFWDCQVWNGSVCGRWTCTSWGMDSTGTQRYCSGYWDCTTWNGSVCDQWQCTAWTTSTYTSDYICNGYWDCQSWNISNQPPTISAVSDSPDPQQGNSNVTFSSTASDPDAGNTIKLYVCKDASCTNCNPTTTSNCWAVTATGVTTNPTATYTCPSCTYAANNYWAKVCDNNNACSSIISGASFTCKKQNGCSETTATNCYSGYAVDGYCCNASCTGTCQTCAATAGTCTTRAANDNTECSTCYRCDGSSTSCQISASGQEGKDCTVACKQCDGSGSCININNAEDTVGTTCSGACKYCSAGTCITVTCAEEGYGATCSSSNVCNNTGTCVAKTANGGSCTVGTCTACSPSTICIFCASGYCSDSTCGLAGQPPTISSVSDSPDPQQGNSVVTFSSAASDPDVGDTIKLYICKDSSCTNCSPTDTSNCWVVTAAGVTTNPTATYTCPSCTYAANNYWAKVCDQTGICSSIITGGGSSFTCKKQNGCAETTATNCYSGYTADGYCCNSACGGNCDRCNVAGSLGTCTNVDADCTGNCDVCSEGNCAASASLCTGDCDICSLVSETVFNCEANQDLCSACSDCSGSVTTFNCEALNNTEDTTGTTCSGACKYCSAGTCITVTCAEEGYGTTCSGSNICNGSSSCVAKAGVDDSCLVTGCTACLPSRSCIFCDLGYCGPNGTCAIPYYLYGWSWTENIGWISFSGSNYKVNLIPIASNVYKLEGYAWSENIGWISFNRSETGAPPDSDPCTDGACIAKLDTSTSPPQLSGWARALAACDTVPCTSYDDDGCSNCGGWDGWIKLRR